MSTCSKPYVTLAVAAVLLAAAPLPSNALSTGFDLPACGQLQPDEQAPATGMDPIRLDNAGTTKVQPSNSILDRARAANLVPPALVPDEQEQQDTQKFMTEAERMQLGELWSATIQRSQQIQFVVDRLQPHSDANRDNSMIARTIGGLLQSAANVAPYVAPAGLSRVGAGAGSSMLGGLLNGHNGKALQNSQVSREQLIVLYKMVQDTADKLVASYRQYRLARNEYSRSMTNMEDAQAIVEAGETKDKTHQYIVDFAVRLARRDLERADDQVHTAQQQLADLAGADAIMKLNDQVDEEQQALQNLVGGSKTASAPLKLKPSQTATGHQAGTEPKGD